VYWSAQKKNKIIATRHDFWAQSVSKMLLQPGDMPRTPLSGHGTPLGPRSWVWRKLQQAWDGGARDKGGWRNAARGD